MWFVVDGFDLGVVMGFAASELEAGDLTAGEIDFAADQPVRPGGIEWEGVSEQTDGSLTFVRRMKITVPRSDR